MWHFGMRPSNILPTHILVRYVTVFLWASFKFWNMRCQDGLSYWDTYTCYKKKKSDFQLYS